ncbi:hypothetical protein IMZ31_21920 (plasmid) [Pontibacillus sp. ALD_SL1]|uniref:hypothetical protein n=1 Tax=Pontibacillus sp. ALD_SL1 TaxID=2777185 RepID=UPI001A965312|nr:hypothetical protein [Pontibacillus sp. ALD_SL1]QST02111.1 hypothetical protein IMZ31_21920 [Pontibacillus sp. ALD_SL1]
MVRVPEGFFFSETYHHYQKVNNEIYVYVTPELFGRWKAQAYLRGTTGFCSLETRIQADGDPKKIEKLFHVAESWLHLYGDDPESMKEDPFNPFHKDGWQGADLEAYEKTHS